MLRGTVLLINVLGIYYVPGQDNYCSVATLALVLGGETHINHDHGQ